MSVAENSNTILPETTIHEDVVCLKFLYPVGDGMGEGFIPLTPGIIERIKSDQPFTVHFEGKDYRNVLWVGRDKCLKVFTKDELKKKYHSKPKPKKKVKHVKEKLDYSKQPRAWILYHHNGPKI